MGEVHKTKGEVESFLKQMKELTYDDDKITINSTPWAGGRVNKTRQYMAETGISKKDMIDTVRELEIKNYSATKEDCNPNFPDEYVWEFGITKKIIDEEEDLYIKLKIRKIEEDYLLIMSFHPEQPPKEEDKLTFPYKDEKEEQG